MGNPLFIIGAARSGTNLVARMLNRHSKIRVALDPAMPIFRALRNAIVARQSNSSLQLRFPPDSPFQDYYFDPLGSSLLEIILSASPDISMGSEELVRLRHECATRAAFESRETSEAIKELQGSTYLEILESLISLIGTHAADAEWVGCKEVWVEDFIPLLAQGMPQCRLICIERDPRAMVASLMAVAANNSNQLAHPPSYMRHWRKGVSLTRQYKQDPVLRDRLFLLHYEDLVSEPNGVAKDLCQFLGLKYEPAMLLLSEDGWHGNSGYEHQGINIYRDSLDRWKKVLPNEITATTDFLCGPEMRLTPYQPAKTESSNDQIAEYLHKAGSQKYSWRSDNGDSFNDYAWEVLRHKMLNGLGVHQEKLLQRCFLFPQIFQAIKATL